jgi:hypothetical protein
MNLHQWATGPTQPPIHCVPGGTVARACSAKVKNGQSCRDTPLYVFLAWSLIKHTNYFMTLPHQLKCQGHIAPKETTFWTRMCLEALGPYEMSIQKVQRES